MPYAEAQKMDQRAMMANFRDPRARKTTHGFITVIFWINHERRDEHEWTWIGTLR